MEKNKECKHEHHGGGFTNGFVFGFVLGGIVVFLLGTKKGKQIMKTLAENGFEGVSELTDLLEDDEAEENYEEAYAEEDIPMDTNPSEENPEKHIVVVHKAAHHPIKRFFRGARK